MTKRFSVSLRIELDIDADEVRADDLVRRVLSDALEIEGYDGVEITIHNALPEPPKISEK